MPNKMIKSGGFAWMYRIRVSSVPPSKLCVSVLSAIDPECGLRGAFSDAPLYRAARVPITTLNAHTTIVVTTVVLIPYRHVITFGICIVR